MWSLTKRKDFGKMEHKDTCIDGVKVLCPKVFGDKRGSFMELWNEATLAEVGIKDVFVQDNISTSVRGVLRGVHTQLRFPQAKIVACLEGEIWDVAVDMRPGSKTFGKWHGELLSAENRRQLYLPEGVAHGFLTMADATVWMKVATHYTPGDEIGFRWDDPTVGIDWPRMDGELTLAEKDLIWDGFAKAMEKVKQYR